MKGVRRFGIKGKLAPRYIGLYPIIDKYGPTSYQVELPAKLSGVYNVFHVSQLKGCLEPPTDVIIDDTIPLEPDLTYKAYPTKILDQQDRVARNKTTRFSRVQWNDHSKDEATWQQASFPLIPKRHTPFIMPPLPRVCTATSDRAALSHPTASNRTPSFSLLHADTPTRTPPPHLVLCRFKREHVPLHGELFFRPLSPSPRLIGHARPLMHPLLPLVPARPLEHPR
jgi:hypothetical protein